MAIRLDIDLLRSFLMVAETGALSRAALQASRSQAALSMQMKRLEELVGQPLLTRTGRGVVLTVHGERLLVHARRILRSHDDALAELSGRSLEGTLRFGCPDDYADAFLPRVLRSFAQLHPHVMIEVVCASTPRLLALLNRRTLDLALTSVAEKSPARDILRREALVWVSQTGDISNLPNPLRLALGDPDALDHLAARAALDRAKIAYQVAYASGSLSGLLAVVRSGQAIAVLTRVAVPTDLSILSGSILSGKSALPALPSLGLSIALDHRNASPETRAFDAHLRAVLPNLQ